MCKALPEPGGGGANTEIWGQPWWCVVEDRPTFQVHPSLQRASAGIKIDHMIEGG